MQKLLISLGFIASLLASILVIAIAYIIGDTFKGIFESLTVYCFSTLFVMVLSGYAMGAASNFIWRKAGLKAPTIQRFNFFFSGALCILGILTAITLIISGGNGLAMLLLFFIFAFALVLPTLYIPAFFFGQWLALEKPANKARTTIQPTS